MAAGVTRGAEVVVVGEAIEVDEEVGVGEAVQQEGLVTLCLHGRLRRRTLAATILSNLNSNSTNLSKRHSHSASLPPHHSETMPSLRHLLHHNIKVDSNSSRSCLRSPSLDGHRLAVRILYRHRPHRRDSL